MPRRRNTEIQNQINRATGIANAGRRAGFSAMNRSQNAFQSGRTLNRGLQRRVVRMANRGSGTGKFTNTGRTRDYGNVRRYDSSRRNPSTGFGRTITRSRVARVYRSGS